MKSAISRRELAGQEEEHAEPVLPRLGVAPAHPLRELTPLQPDLDEVRPVAQRRQVGRIELRQSVRVGAEDAALCRRVAVDQQLVAAEHLGGDAAGDRRLDLELRLRRRSRDVDRAAERHRLPVMGAALGPDLGGRLTLAWGLVEVAVFSGPQELARVRQPRVRRQLEPVAESRQIRRRRRRRRAISARRHGGHGHQRQRRHNCESPPRPIHASDLPTVTRGAPTRHV